MSQFLSVFEELAQGKVAAGTEQVKVYEKSFTTHEAVNLLIAKEGSNKVLLATGQGELFDALEGEVVADGQKVAPLSHENRLVLNKFFPYTKPQAFGTKVATVGLGDRLGLASPGHIDAITKTKAKPVLAQQSIRELTLTNRSMNDMLDAAAFAVFQEGYTGGYGADGDHIKLESDIEMALSLGISMLTLDCSDHIPTGLGAESAESIKEKYDQLPEDVRSRYENTYIGKTFDVNGLSITFDELTLQKYALEYNKAIQYTIHVYNQYIATAGRDIDYEISIDETETITSPQAHFFVANELIEAGVKVISLAPRFCGEFQKGIDYIGDVVQFEKELSEHAAIAEHFGYKLSIHSGSDKFTVFPIIAKYTKGILHVKTAGTNWLEAIRVISKVNPDLYRRMHRFALDHFEEALKYYVVTTDLSKIAPLDETSDADLVEYMNEDNARQLFHITYGLILTAKDDQGHSLFADEFFDELNKHEDEYRASLASHIGKHLQLLEL